MVTLAGAKAAAPFVSEIVKLQAAFDLLNVAANEVTSTIWKLDIQVYVKGVSATITITDNFAHADAAAILFDIRNIIGTKINVQTNLLGAIA